MLGNLHGVVKATEKVQLTRGSRERFFISEEFKEMWPVLWVGKSAVIISSSGWLPAWGIWEFPRESSRDRTLRFVVFHREVLTHCIARYMVFYHYCNKLAQIEWLKTTYIYCLAVLSVRSPTWVSLQQIWSLGKIVFLSGGSK